MFLSPSQRYTEQRVTPEQSMHTGKNSMSILLNQTSLTSRLELSTNNQLFQSKEQRRQFRRDIRASVEYTLSRETAPLTQVSNHLLHLNIRRVFSLFLTISMCFLLHIEALYRNYLDIAEIYALKCAQSSLLFAFLVEFGVDLLIIEKKCSFWISFDVLVTLWTIFWEVFSLFRPENYVNLLMFFCVFRLIRPSNSLKSRNKDKLLTSPSLAVPTSTVNSAPLRVLCLLKRLRSESFIRSDKFLLREVEWSLDVVSSGALYEAVLTVQNNNDKISFKQEDLMNLVKLYSATPKPISSSQDRLRAGSINDSIPIKDLLLGLPMETMDCLSKVDTYEFNVFTLKMMTDGNELRTLMHIFFARMDLFAATGIESTPFGSFIDRIQLGYSQVIPYHTATHAADVLQAINFYLGPCAGGDWLVLTPIELAGAYLAASIHDYEHPGVNNSYLISTQSELAIRYNDQAVLENFHVASAWELTMSEEYDFLAQLAREDAQKIRGLTIEMVLGTDVAQHFSLISHFKSKQTTFSSLLKDEEKSLVLTILLHTADISNPSRPWDLCERWTYLVMEEFWLQGDREREAGLDLAYLFDRYTVNVAKSQVGFIEVIAEPLFKTVRESLPLLDSCCRYLEGNKTRWSELVPRSEEELEERRNALLKAT